MGRPSGLAVTVLERGSRLRAAAAKLAARVRGMRLIEDRSGATAMIVGLSATMLVGFAGLGTEMGLWYFTHRSLQNAADSAAMSAEAALFYADGNYIKEAKASAGRYGFVDGANGVSVTVNKPPASGAFAGVGDAVEVIISEPQVRLFTAMFSNNALTQTARAVAQVGSNGNGCVVTLDKNAVVDFFGNGNTSLNLNSCDLYVNADACDAIDQSGNHTSITAQNIYVVAATGCNGISGNGNVTGNIIAHVAPINDPYANVPQPGSHDSSCTNTSPTAANTITGGNVTLSPGNYCGGISVTGGASVTLNPGVYVIDGGSLSAGGNGGNSSGTITGTGVTIFLTGSGSNYATAQIAGNGAVNITPPTTGDSAGIGIFQDRNAPGPSCDVSTTNCTPQNKIQGNGDAITGVAYFPNQSVGWGGNGSTNSQACAQIVAFQLQTVGNAQFSNNCAGVAGVKSIGALAGRLVE